MGRGLLRVGCAMASLTLTAAQTSANATIPDYVFTYAPLVYLDINEQYYPSDVAAQVVHTYPAINYTAIDNVPAGLGLSNLSSLNSLAGCTYFDDCTSLYLTSKDQVTERPPSPEWLYGVPPDPVTGETEGVTSSIVIVNDHQNGTVDAYFMFFYAFNEGIPVGNPNGSLYDDHVGDWEHMMVRFVDEKPLTVYYSIHSSGQAYTYDATVKNGSRPLGFASKGGHATYPQSGVYVMYSGAANDTASRGPLWDPIAGSGAWYYVFTPTNATGDNGTFTPVNVPGRTARGVGPTDWLHYYGRWGDKQYNASYPGQKFIGSLTAVFTDGPTGPLDKDLNRVNACPGNGDCVTTTTVTSATSVSTTQTVNRSYTSAATTTTGGSSGVKPTTTTTTGGSPTATSSRAAAPPQRLEVGRSRQSFLVALGGALGLLVW